jgi:fibronectin-binding autotransporter adhesin
LTDTNWDNEANANDIAVFGGSSSGAVTVSGTIATGGLQFQVAGYSLTSGTLILSAPSGSTPTIDTEGNDVTISSVLSGEGFQKLSDGTLTLAGSNNFTGTETISGGAVQISSDANLGATSTALVLDSGTLATTASLTLLSTRPLSVTSQGGSIQTVQGTALSYGGVISGPGGLIKTGGGTLSLSGDSTYTGGTQVAAGEFHLAAGTLASGVSVTTGIFSGIGSVAGPVVIGSGSGTAIDAILAPGGAGTIGALSLQSLTLNSDAALDITLFSSSSPTFDQIILSGSSNLGNGIATLNLTDLGTLRLALNSTFLILDNTSSLPTTGYFAGLPNGSDITAGANTYEIDYGVGASGNNVQIRVVPEPRTWAMLLAGLALLAGHRRARRDQRHIT